MGEDIEIVEIGPRDGLQNEALIMSTSDKVALVERAIGYGARLSTRSVADVADVAGRGQGRRG